MNRIFSSRLIIALVLVCLGLGGLWGASLLHKDHETWARFLDHMSAALLVVGLISVLEKLVAEREAMKHWIEMFDLRESVHRAGIESAYLGAGDCDYSEILLRSQCVTIVLNDGKKWTNDKKADLLRKRLAKPGFETIVFLLNPESPFLDELAKKTHATEVTPEVEKGRIQQKIRETISALRDLHLESEKKGTLEIRLLLRFPTYTLCIGDDSAIATMYTASSWKTLDIPVLELRKKGTGDLFSFFEQDVARLRTSQSELLGELKS